MIATGVDNKNRELPLDGLRAIAIFMVIGCHYPAFATSFGGIPELGWLGVDIFFVLSGFLITGILLRIKPESRPLTRFYIARFWRIFPPYYLVVIALTLLTFAVSGRLESGNAFLHGLFLISFEHTAETVSRFLTGRPLTLLKGALVEQPHGIVPYGFGAGLIPMWSLSVEEWFYILWAPVVIFCRRSTAISCSVIAIAGAILFRWLGFNVASFAWQQNFFARMDTLAIGSLLAIFWPVVVRRRNAPLFLTLAPVTGLLLICLNAPSIIRYDPRFSPGFVIFGYSLIALAAAGFIALIVTGRWRFAREVFGSKALVYIGQRSYMMYLVHVAVYFLVSRLAWDSWAGAVASTPRPSPRGRWT